MSELPSDIFGCSPTKGYERTWDNVRLTLAVYFTRRFHDVSTEEVDDVVSSVMCDLVERWVTYPSSISEDKQRNWNYALRYGRWKGAERLMKHFRLREREVSMDASYDALHDHEKRGFRGHSADKHAMDTAASAVADVCASQAAFREDSEPSEESLNRMRAFLATIDQADLDEWLVPMLQGESVREQSKREGYANNHANISRRRSAGVLRLYERAVEMGACRRAA